MRRQQLVIDDTGSVDDIHAFIYCKKWRFWQVSPMPDWLTHSQTLKDSATQLLIKYKSGALVTQCNTKWWWLLVSGGGGGGDTFWDNSMLQRRQWPHKCPYSDADKAILSLNTMQSTHVDSLHFKWKKMLFHTEKEKRVFRPGRCVLRRERARNSSTNLRFCLSVCAQDQKVSCLPVG